MPVGPQEVYTPGFKAICDQDMDFVNDAFVCLLLVDGHTKDLANHEFISDVIGDECADGDYARQALSGKSINTVLGKIRYDCADIDFGDTVSIAARFKVIAKNTGNNATSRLLTICDLNTGGGNLQSTASDFDAAINANGVFEVTLNA